jgi:hypothetical protein
MKKVLLVLVIVFVCSVAESQAQCAMCKSVAESNMKTAENNVGRSLNNGILYLLAIPYIIGGIGAIAWLRNRRKSKRNDFSKA